MPKKRTASTKPLAQDAQDDMFEKSRAEEVEARRNTPVTCLGMEFPNEDVRRAHFLGELAKKLRDPAFRKIEGFPIGEDADILAMSDPPFYTACPNPWLADIVTEWEKTKPKRARKEYAREPFAVDVSEGKTDPLYKAHSYHTKVPHLAIVPSILHYTEPGDTVLDGFCGSGMTGVAAQWCGAAPESYRKELEAAWKRDGRDAPKWGARRVVLNDLSPAATFIASNYNMPFDVPAFARGGRDLLDNLEEEIGWMYETLHSDRRTKGRIQYTVWSEVFSCPECAHELVFSEVGVDEDTGDVLRDFNCSKCGALLSKRSLARVRTTRHDELTGATSTQTRRVATLIFYTVDGVVYEKAPDAHDIQLLSRIDDTSLPITIPCYRMMFAPTSQDRWGDEWRSGTASFSHLHHAFTRRSLIMLGCAWRIATAVKDPAIRRSLLFCLEQSIWGFSLANRYAPSHFSQVNRYLAGHLRLMSRHSECSPWYALEGKLQRLIQAFSGARLAQGDAAVAVGSCGSLQLADASVDYIFTDPPFGDNLAYSELNFAIEAFHRVFTNQAPEAIVSEYQEKDLRGYGALMGSCFSEYHRVLRAGRWMTVVFHNSRNSVWTAIQEAMLEAGFVVADVRTLDKQQGSFNQVTTSTAMKQDLVISAYKPTDELERRFQLEAGSDAGMWQFVDQHLRQLPTFVLTKEGIETIAERTAHMLFDRMVAFHVQRGATVPMSASEFFRALVSRYPCRDEMYFLPAQAAEYDKERAKHSGVVQFELFVSDEASAIAWLLQQLTRKPQTTQELTPQFINELRSWQKHEKPLELRELLQDNFLCYAGTGEVPSQIHSYLSTNWKEFRGMKKDDPELVAKAKDRWYVPDPKKAEDLEKVRDRTLLREFWEYLPEGYKPQVKTDMQAELPGLAEAQRVASGRRMKVIRTEAVRTGFKYCWQNQDYRTIVTVARRIPEDVLQEDPKLLMWYDQALTRLGEE